MSVRADLYISGNDEAVRYNTTPDEFAERAQYKSITPLELSTLWAMMRGIDWDIAWMDEFLCLLQQGGGERVIHRLPAAMLADLSRLTPDQIAVVTSKWAATEQLGWPADETRPVVEDLVRLARRAGESGRGVYLWNCV
jgi:hypothetical protein